MTGKRLLLMSCVVCLMSFSHFLGVANPALASEPWAVTALPNTHPWAEGIAVDRDRVAYPTGNSPNQKLCVYDSSTLETWTLSESGLTWSPEDVKMSGRYVVWEESVHDGSGQPSKFMLFDTLTNQYRLIADGPLFPQFYSYSMQGDYIAWTAFDEQRVGQIFLYCLSTGSLTQLQDDEGFTRTANLPVTDGGRVIWPLCDLVWGPDGLTTDPGSVRLIEHNIGTGARKVVGYDDLAQMHLSGDWLGGVVATSTYPEQQVVILNTSTGERRQLTSGATGRRLVDLEGDYAVWLEGADPFARKALYSYRISTGVTTLIASGGAMEASEIDDNRVAYCDRYSPGGVIVRDLLSGTDAGMPQRARYCEDLHLSPTLLVYQGGALHGSNGRLIVERQPNFTGQVTAGLDPAAGPRTLPTVKISALLDNGRAMHTWTDHLGWYGFYVPQGRRVAQVSVQLVREDGWLGATVDGFSSAVAVARDAPAGAGRIDIDLSRAQESGYLTEVSGAHFSQVYPSALVFWNTSRGFLQAEEWDVSFDRPIPVRVYADGTYYSPDLGQVSVSAVNMRGVIPGFQRVDYIKNREWHELGHAVMDALYGQAEDGSRRMSGLWAVPGPQYNHWGYANRTTGDSLAEGFAEFFAMALAEAFGDSQPSKYDKHGNYEDNIKAWVPGDASWLWRLGFTIDYPREEAAFAGVLWDLHDGFDSADDDYVGPIALPDILKLFRLNKPMHVADFAIAAWGEPWGDHGVSNNLANHGFFADTNGNLAADFGEEVGTRTTTSRSLTFRVYDWELNSDRLVTADPNRERPSRPEEPWLNLRLLPGDLGGVDLTPGAVLQVRFTYPAPHEYLDWSYHADVEDAGTLVYLSPPLPLADGTLPVVTLHLLDNAGIPGPTLYTVNAEDAYYRAYVAMIEGATCYLAPQAESPEVSAGGPYKGLAGDTLTLVGSTTVPEAETAQVAWDLSYDGVTFVPEKEGLTTEVTYAEAGSCLVALRVTDTSGASYLATAPVVLAGMRRDFEPGWHLVAGGTGSDTGGLPLFAYSIGAYASTAAESLAFGGGYWIRLPDERSLVLTSVSGSLGLHLAVGWNLIGNSTAARLSLPEGLIAFTYNGAAYQSTSTLEPGEGAWVKVTEEQDIVLTPGS